MLIFLYDVVMKVILEHLFYRISYAYTVIFAYLRPFKRPYLSKITENIFLGALPRKTDLYFMSENNIKSIISLNQPFELKPRKGINIVNDDDLKENNIVRHIFSTPDRTPVSINHLINIVNLIDESSKKNSVYIHCKAGRGRSYMCVIAYLIMKNPNLNLDEIEKIVKKKRPHVFLNKKQREYINKNIEKLRKL
jgi:atypical dual specificity phosphatase